MNRGREEGKGVKEKEERNEQRKEEGKERAEPLEELTGIQEHKRNLYQKTY